MEVRAKSPTRPRQLAERLGMATPKPIYNAIASGALRHYRMGRAVYVTEADWLAMLERNAVEPGEYRPDPLRSERARRRAMAGGK